MSKTTLPPSFSHSFPSLDRHHCCAEPWLAARLPWRRPQYINGAMFVERSTARQEILCILISHPSDGAPAGLSGEQEPHKRMEALFLYLARFPHFEPGINKTFEVQTTKFVLQVLGIKWKVCEKQKKGVVKLWMHWNMKHFKTCS